MRNCRPFAMGSAVLGAISPITTVSCCFPEAAATGTLRGLPCRKFFDWLTVSLVGKTYFPRLRSSPASKISLRSGSLQDVEKVNTRRLAGQNFAETCTAVSVQWGNHVKQAKFAALRPYLTPRKAWQTHRGRQKLLRFPFLRTCFLRCGLPWHPLCPPANPEIWRSPII